MENDTLPTISVILPVRNGEKTIERAIKSVLAQQYPNTELIVLDGRSTDTTVEIIKQYEASIAYWHSQSDGGCGSAINMGFEKATGTLIVQLMADDWFEPGIFHAIANAYREHPETEMISCAGRIVQWDANTNTYQTIAAYSTDEQLAMTVHNMCFGIPAMSSRFLTRKLVDKMGVLKALDDDGKHIYSADRELLLRAAVLNSKNIIIHHLGHSYCAHPESATFGGNRAIQLKIYREHMQCVELYLKRYPLSPEVKRLLQYWYHHQSVRYVLYQLKAGQCLMAWQAVKRAMSHSKWMWFRVLCQAPYHVVRKK